MVLFLRLPSGEATYKDDISHSMGQTTRGHLGAERSIDQPPDILPAGPRPFLALFVAISGTQDGDGQRLSYSVPRPHSATQPLSLSLPKRNQQAGFYFLTTPR